LVRAGIGGLLVVLLAACGTPLPKPHPDPKPAQAPLIVEQVQTERILDDLSRRLEQSAEEASLDPLMPRLGGAALAMRTAELAARAADQAAPMAALGTEFVDKQIVTTSKDWPRSFIAVTEPVDAQARYLYQMTQTDPRSQYKMMSWARMVAGSQLPKTASPELGSPVLGMDDATLAVTPAAALAAYAKAKEAPDSEEAKLFGGDVDPVRESWVATASSFSSVAAAQQGSVAHTSEVSPGTGLAIQTADGGALVWGEITSTMGFTFPPKDGAFIKIPAYYQGLGAATVQPTTSASIQYIQTVVLAVPPAGSTDPIMVVAVAHAPITVTAR
jgi:hypothetical protein